MSMAINRKYLSPKFNTESKYDGPLRVIGIGLPRTGTSSLKAALDILGFGSCHHITELYENPDRSEDFMRTCNGEKVNFNTLMKGYGSTVCIPTSDLYKESLEAYPDAKLVLTV